MQMAVTTIDPMANRFHGQIRERKRDELYGLWKKLEGFTHHNCKQNIKSFKKCLEGLENTVFDLLAPINAENQKEIQSILGNANRSETDVENMFSLIERKGANYVFFFKYAADNADIAWLSHLDNGDYFANPPNAEPIGEGSANYPFWWPMHYLARMAPHARGDVIKDVIEIVLRLPKTDNPWIYNEIVEITLQLPAKSLRKTSNQKYLNMQIWNTISWHIDSLDVLALLDGKENQITEALQGLQRALVEFCARSSRSETKQQTSGIEEPIDLDSLLAMLGDYVT